MMNELNKRARELRLRRRVGGWQRAAAGLLVLAAAGNGVLLGLLARQEKAAEELEVKYRAAVQIQQEAVQAYGELIAQLDSEQAAREDAAAAFAGLAGYRFIGECTVTYYCCEDYGHICNDGDTVTAAGLEVQPGMVAVDPRVIPLGSTVIVNGTSYLAADTGVTGNHVDIAVDTHGEALELGIGTAEVWIVEKE